jgi:hypothetical protein
LATADWGPFGAVAALDPEWWDQIQFPPSPGAHICPPPSFSTFVPVIRVLAWNQATVVSIIQPVRYFHFAKPIAPPHQFKKHKKIIKEKQAIFGSVRFLEYWIVGGMGERNKNPPLYSNQVLHYSLVYWRKEPIRSHRYECTSHRAVALQ